MNNTVKLLVYSISAFVLLALLTFAEPNVAYSFFFLIIILSWGGVRYLKVANKDIYLAVVAGDAFALLLSFGIPVIFEQISIWEAIGATIVYLIYALILTVIFVFIARKINNLNR